VIKAQYDFVASKAEIDKANGKLLPTVDLQASTNRDEASNKYVNPLFPNVRKDSINTTNNVVKVEMKMDLYAGGRFSSKKRQAHEASVAKRLKIEAVKTELTGAVKSVYESYHAAKTNIENFKKQVKAAEVALEATRQEMDVGTKVLLDVLNAQKELVEAQLRLIDAEKNFFQFAFQMVSFLGGLHAKAMKLSVNYFDPATHFNRMPVGF
jgi:outer membrane protein TolC